MEKVSFKEKFALFTEYWTPKIVSELNGQYVKLVKCKGEMVWHRHEGEDEFFWVHKGSLTIHFRDRAVKLDEGECLVVPRGVEHRPSAESEAHIMLFEPKGTAHTGDTVSELTVNEEDQVWI